MQFNRNFERWFEASDAVKAGALFFILCGSTKAPTLPAPLTKYG
jgi:hypothetical protein